MLCAFSAASPAQRHLLANVAFSGGKVDLKFPFRCDGSALHIQACAPVPLPQEERLRAVALGLEQQSQ